MKSLMLELDDRIIKLTDWTDCFHDVMALVRDVVHFCKEVRIPTGKLKMIVLITKTNAELDVFLHRQGMLLLEEYLEKIPVSQPNQDSVFSVTMENYQMEPEGGCSEMEIEYDVCRIKDVISYLNASIGCTLRIYRYKNKPYSLCCKFLMCSPKFISR